MPAGTSISISRRGSSGTIGLLERRARIGAVPPFFRRSRRLEVGEHSLRLKKERLESAQRAPFGSSRLGLWNWSRDPTIFSILSPRVGAKYLPLGQIASRP